MKRGWRVLSAVALLVLAGCARFRGAPRPDAGEAADRESIVIVVNNYSLPMEVEASGGGTTHRLGVVAPGISRSFVVPRALVATNGLVEFRAHPTASGTMVRADPLQLHAGAVVDFEIATTLIGTHATIRQ